jgi:hypothetical protein
MNPVVKQILLIGALVVIVAAVFIVSLVMSNKKATDNNAARFAIVKNIQFKGKVISHKTFEYGGRHSYMVCLKLDYANVKSFYALNSVCFLKIKNGVATMAVGLLDPYYGIPTYVEINMNNDGMERYTYPGGKAQSFDLSLANYDLTEKDLNTCN